MALYRGSGGAGDATTDAYASQISNYAQTASAKAKEASASAASSQLYAQDALLSSQNSAFESQQAQIASNLAQSSAYSAELAKQEAQQIVEGINTSFFQQTTEPTEGIDLGDLWFNTGTSDLYVYREISSNTFEWVAILINNISDDSDILDAGAF
jgi:hypothetical protein